MAASVKVNLHCHSSLSDGELAPEALAARLAHAGAQVAALTDHDTIGGLARFHEALESRGVRHIAGLELTAGDGGAVHLLAYGFDPESPALAEALGRARQAPEGGGLPVEDAIALIHRAGGRAFLAHPLVLDSDLGKLEARLRRYRQFGLDGVEAIYASYPRERVQALEELARRLGLAISAGCDYHGEHAPGLSDLVVEFSADDWRAFRDLVMESTPARSRAIPAPPRRREAQRLDWRNFLLRILLPTLLAISLLVGPLFVYLIPAFEEALLARKREMIRELTRSAASILQEYHQEELDGRFNRADAQAAAIARIQYLRYGKEGKDYFWITDDHPRMVMHPYRTDLNGQDLSEFRDPKGNRVFVEMVRLARQGREGYLEYVWQWKDDVRRLAPKQSYVRRFEPWGWVIGTGLYIEDVNAEIRDYTTRVIRVSLIIALVIALLLSSVALQGFRLERQRSRAEEALHESHERYRALVESSKEGTVLILNGRTTCANQTFLALTGFTEGQLALMDIDELLEVPGSGPIRRLMDEMKEDAPPPEPMEARLHHRGGGSLDVLLSLEPIRVGNRRGFSLIVRDLSSHKEMQAALEESQAQFRAVAENLRVGVFRASLDAGFPLVEANPAARRLFRTGEGDDLPRLADVLADQAAMEAVAEELRSRGEVRDRVLDLNPAVGGGQVSLSATLVNDENGQPRFCDAVAEDVTVRQREAREREALIADLQSAQLYLGKSVERFMRPAVFTDCACPLERAAQLMVRHGSDALIVQGTAGEALGMVTDRDLRERVVARGVALSTPVYEIMSAPILAISRSVQGHEALGLMRDRGVGHLAVKEPNGSVAGILHARDLQQVDYYPLALLSRGIREASRPEEVFHQKERLPSIANSLLESGARSKHICRAISAVTDAVTEKLVALAQAQLGPPPVPWVFLALGSQGREEQTLLADQDNAILFAQPPDADEATATAYFQALARTVTGWLTQAGYPPCKGDVMASNPRWCQPLEQWQRYFRDWIRHAEPQNRLEFTTFFDFRGVCGDPGLALALGRFVLQELADSPAFFPLLARDVVQYKPPKGLFGGLGHGHGGIDTKDTAAAIENLARLFALYHGIRETSTFERLRRLQEAGALSPSGHEELSQGYDFLMKLRLRHQVERLLAGLPADNEVDPKSLNHLEESLLKEVFTQISTFHKKIHLDFLGSAGL
jgi:PAS domain S-box-containing protein